MDFLNENFKTAQGRLWRFHVYPKNSKHVSTGYVLFICCDCFINGLPHQICWDVFVSSLLDTSGMIYSISRDETWLSFAHCFFWGGLGMVGPLVSEGPTWRSRVFGRIEVPIWHTSGTSKKTSGSLGNFFRFCHSQVSGGTPLTQISSGSIPCLIWSHILHILSPFNDRYDDMIVNSVNSS